MGFKAYLLSLRERASAFTRSRDISTRLFSGTPVLEKIRLDRGEEGPVFTLFYKNGLMLSLGDSGVLDYQDRGFDGFVGPGSRATGDREFLTSLHRIVLKSLLRYITAPRLETRQRERAAEAASKLWLACSGRPAPRARTGAEEESGPRREHARFG